MSSCRATNANAYVSALVRAQLLAPEGSSQEDLLDVALRDAALVFKRSDNDIAEIQERESARLREEGLL